MTLTTFCITTHSGLDVSTLQGIMTKIGSGCLNPFTPKGSPFDD